jgi:Interferon-induced transmembrane protein/GYF domain 2
MAQWYYSKNGTQLGPVALEVLRSKLRSGEVSPADLVWKDGMTDWQPAGKIADLAISSMEAQPPMQAPPIGGMQSPYAPPVAAPGPIRYGAPLPNYLWQSIVVTLLCCLPFGVAAIVMAAKVEGLVARGDMQGAIAASASAKKWCLVALISGFVIQAGMVAAPQ